MKYIKGFFNNTFVHWLIVTAAGFAVEYFTKLPMASLTVGAVVHAAYEYLLTKSAK